jgi:hypothetical protein
VTVRYRPGSETVDQTAAQGMVRDRLLAAGEERFPYMNHIYPDIRLLPTTRRKTCGLRRD